MYVVSCRAGFESDQILAKENRCRNFKNPAKPDVFDDMTLAELRTAASNKHVAILVHGLNSSITQVMASYWEIVDRMNQTGVFGPAGYGLVIGFTWPGMATSPGFFPALLTAKKAAPHLRELIDDLRPHAHTIDVQTHSLGARVALTALREPKKVFVDNLILSAPAVDNHLLEPDRDFAPSMESCNRCFVYHSKNDPVLKFSFLLGDIADGIHKALGLNGPRSKPLTVATKNVYVVDCAQRVKDHSGYRKTNKYFQHWKQALSGAPMNRYDELS